MLSDPIVLFVQVLVPDRHTIPVDVTVPVLVPFKITFTPGKADPSSEDVTFPETVLSCAHALVVSSDKTIAK